MTDSLIKPVSAFSADLSYERRAACCVLDGKIAFLLSPARKANMGDYWQEITERYAQIIQSLMITHPGVDTHALVLGYFKKLVLRAADSDPTLFKTQEELETLPNLTVFETEDLLVVWYGLFQGYRPDTWENGDVPNTVIVEVSRDNDTVTCRPMVIARTKMEECQSEADDEKPDEIMAFATAVVSGMKVDYPAEYGGVLYVFNHPETGVLTGAMLLPAPLSDRGPDDIARDMALLKELLLGNKDDVATMSEEERRNLFIRQIGYLLNDWVMSRINNPDVKEMLTKSPLLLMRTRMTSVILEAVDLFGPTLLNKVGTISGFITLADVGGSYRVVDHSTMRFATNTSQIEGMGAPFQTAVDAVRNQLKDEVDADTKFVYMPIDDTTEITLASPAKLKGEVEERQKGLDHSQLEGKSGVVGELMTSLVNNIVETIDVNAVPERDGTRFVGAIHPAGILIWDMLERVYGKDQLPSMISQANAVAVIKGGDGVTRFIFTKA